MKIINYFRLIKGEYLQQKQVINYYKKFKKFSFIDCRCTTPIQYDASITRLYHTIEKGLSYSDYRAGFGKENIEKLLISLEQYALKGFDTTAFFYETALSCLYAYVNKNREYGQEDPALDERIKKIPGKANECGGTIIVSRPVDTESMTYEQIVKNRHSIRHFSDKPVELKTLKEAIRLAQYTPSACNRQGWKTRIVVDKDRINAILANQNGNRGFGQEIDKLLVVTADLQAQQRSREIFQAFIDGGMYAESILNSLFSFGIGSCPLSASLTKSQDENVRKLLNIHEAEVLIMFIGVGNYPEEEFLVTRSERKQTIVDVY